MCRAKGEKRAGRSPILPSKESGDRPVAPDYKTTRRNRLGAGSGEFLWPVLSLRPTIAIEQRAFSGRCAQRPRGKNNCSGV